MSEYLLLKTNNPISNFHTVEVWFTYDQITILGTVSSNTGSYLVMATPDESDDYLSYLYVKGNVDDLVVNDKVTTDPHKMYKFIEGSDEIWNVTFRWNNDSTVDITYAKKQFDELPQDWLPQIHG